MAIQVSIFDLLEEIDKPKKEDVKRYSMEDYRKYILDNFKPKGENDVFYNIILSSKFSNDSLGKFYRVEPKEQLDYFKKKYNSFTWHLCNSNYSIFSLKNEYDNCDTDYSVFVKVDGDYIVELPTVKDLFNENLCAPACGIWFYDKNGNMLTSYDYMKLTNEESVIWRNYIHCSNEIIPPQETKTHSTSEWWRDRREYYFFHKLQIKKYAHNDRVCNFGYDCFTNYEWTLKEMYFYLKDRGVPVE